MLSAELGRAVTRPLHSDPTLRTLVVMTPNPSQRSPGESGRRHELALDSSRCSTLLDAANGEDARAREAVSLLIRNHPADLPSGFLDEAARTAKYASIAQSLLLCVDSMSYLARRALAQKFQKIGRDDCVLNCLANAAPHNGDGLRILCEAPLRGRFINTADVDVRSPLFAASFEDLRAEVLWIRHFLLREQHGRDSERSVRRLIDIAEKDLLPEALNSIGEMLICNELSSPQSDSARQCFKRASLLGYSPAKLNLARHFLADRHVAVQHYLAEFFNEAHFPGLAWCYTTLRSDERPFRLIDSILKAYLWHPDIPIASAGEISAAVSVAERLSLEERVSVAQWALRNEILVLDGAYPAVCG